jgi:hypothetical protein
VPHVDADSGVAVRSGDGAKREVRRLALPQAMHLQAEGLCLAADGMRVPC